MFFLLDAQTQLTQAQSALVNQTVQYRRNLTTLLRVTGDLLEISSSESNRSHLLRNNAGRDIVSRPFCRYQLAPCTL